MNDDKRPSLGEAGRRYVEAKPPVVCVEQVVVRCGHTVPFELFDPKKDKFRQGRRKKLTDRDCRDCREKAQQERTRAEMEAARKLRQERPKNDAPPPRAQGRLPHGSRFDATWDAAAGKWSGALTVPAAAAEGEPNTFTASAASVFGLLGALDGMYRATLPS